MGESSFTLEELAKHVDARVSGDPREVISGLGSLQNACPGQLSHLSSSAYKRYLDDTAASAVILDEKNLEHWSGNAIVTGNPYLAFAKISQLFAEVPELAPGLDSSAKVDERAILAASAAVGPGVVIASDCEIGANARIYANVVIGARSRIGEGVMLMPNVVLGADVSVGARSVVHGGAVIGGDGFGFTPDEHGR
ncbi:MAG: UDP-3-O-(3-hydroxymyristoyl)glucosamine N-acyltransferase, partial [Gammaproteobacteria bacterium]|nr:UDP-3-O-(3-hydroxymyristoyl)glucosamine N-acyltransferase [Gammaproteobacteria bacterium]